MNSYHNLMGKKLIRISFLRIWEKFFEQRFKVSYTLYYYYKISWIKITWHEHAFSGGFGCFVQNGNFYKWTLGCKCNFNVCNE